MTIQECYRTLGGSFEEVAGRIPSTDLIRRFLAKFPDDTSFSALSDAMRAGQPEEAFRAAHTLKGVSANLSFSRLHASVEKLTELLRHQTQVMPEGADALFGEVARDYELTVDTIRAYLEAAE